MVLTKQLPLYLKATRSTSGIFLVMWFKDEKQNILIEPTGQNKSQMIEFIEEKIKEIKDKEQINIVSFLIDASKKPSASHS